MVRIQHRAQPDIVIPREIFQTGVLRGESVAFTLYAALLFGEDFGEAVAASGLQEADARKALGKLRALKLVDVTEDAITVLPPPKRERADLAGDLFEEAWDLYRTIRRSNNPKKGARKAWDARVREGVKPSEMLEGLKKYVAFVQSEGTHERYVKQAATFFGPDHHFASDYTPLEEEGDGKKSSELLEYYRQEKLI